jgi:pimeloyl-ACP methyl ester carboxylesterase
MIMLGCHPRVLSWFALTLLLISCQGVSGNLEKAKEWRTPELKKARSTAEFERQIAPLLGVLKRPKVIFIGVYGGNPQPWESAGWFDPQSWPAYRAVDLRDKTGLNRIAYHDSLMHVVALHVGKFFADNLTLMIQGDSDVVSDVIDLVYAPGDRLLLAGHSFGGRVIGEVARDLAKKSIPVELLLYIESFWSSGSIPANVRHAFNFYVPVSLALCPGLSAIKAEDERATQLTNVAVPDPVGPYGGFCSEHRNIDSDPRVWQRIVEFLRQQAAGEAR